MGNLLRTFMDVLVIVDHVSLACGHDSFVGRVMYLQMVFNSQAVHSCFFGNGTKLVLWSSRHLRCCEEVSQIKFFEVLI